MKAEVKQSRRTLRATLCRLVRQGNYVDPGALRELLDKDWNEGTDAYAGKSLETRGAIAYATKPTDRYDVIRRRQTTLVRYLRARWPTECATLTSDLERLGEDYMVENAVFDDIAEGSGWDIVDVYGSGIAYSCMAGESDLLELYVNNDRHVGILTWAGKARALVWTDEDGQRYLDRCYPNHSVGARVLRRYAVSQGWHVRDGDSYSADGFRDSEGELVHLSLRLEVPLSELMPFIDTLRYGRDWDGYSITLSSSSQGREYTFDATDGSGLVSQCTCDSCRERVPEDESRTPYYDDATYCQSCFEELYTYCDCCGEESRRDDCVETRDHWEVCPDCVTARYRQCPECGDYVPDSDFGEDPDGDVCDYCYEPEPEED
jgi:hypothetical protein